MRLLRKIIMVLSKNILYQVLSDSNDCNLMSPKARVYFLRKDNHDWLLHHTYCRGKVRRTGTSYDPAFKIMENPKDNHDSPACLRSELTV